MGGQTSYNTIQDIATPGQLADLNLDSRVVSYPAGENIEFGRLCEVDSAGVLHHVSGVSNVITGGTGGTSKLAGVCVKDVAREQQLASSGGSAGSAFYQSGEMVPVLRKGRIFGAFDGSGTASVLSQPNVWHPSTTDTNDIRGVFTLASTSVVAGSEVAQVPAEILTVRDVGSLTPRLGHGNSAPGAQPGGPFTFVVLLEVNLPGA